MTSKQKEQITSLFDDKFIIHASKKGPFSYIHVMDKQGNSYGELSIMETAYIYDRYKIDIHVEEYERGNGYGTILLQTMEQIATYLSATSVWLEANIEMWYPDWLLRKGYTPSITVNKDTCIIMAKDLYPL